MPRTHRVTIDDVAAAASVSRQTVSNVLRGTGRVGAATAERVREVIDRLGYVVHPGASSLRSSRIGQLAFPLDEMAMHPRDVASPEFIRALTGAAGRRGYHVLLMAPGLDAIRALIRSGRVDGFVFANMRHDDPRVSMVAEFDLPFACMGRTAPEQRQSWVDIDNTNATRLATEHLAALGHRDILYLGYAPNAYWDVERASGYREAMTRLGLTPREVATDYDDARAARAAASVLDDPRRPSAVVCSADELASALYTAAADRGLVIGRDLAVTGFGHDQIGRHLAPSLTTLAVPLDEVAERVMKRFLSELDNGPDRPGELLMPELVVGASSGTGNPG